MSLVVEKQIIDELEKSSAEYVNATCPFVTKIHNIVKKQDENTIVLIAGDKNHPEVKGIVSYGKKVYVVLSTNDIEINSPLLLMV